VINKNDRLLKMKVQDPIHLNKSIIRL